MSESRQRLTESVSALVDGEVNELELHRILKELELEGSSDQFKSNNQSISNKWSSYNLISQTLAGTPRVGKNISQSVHDILASKPKYKTNILRDVFQIKPISRFAVAASVATMSIIGIQQLNNSSLLHGQDYKPSTVAVDNVKSIQRPANQFPSGFQPIIEARTVNAGGVIRTSKQPPLIKLVIPKNKEANKNIMDDSSVEQSKDSVE